jgi:hypothetical protein
MKVNVLWDPCSLVIRDVSESPSVSTSGHIHAVRLNSEDSNGRILQEQYRIFLYLGYGNRMRGRGRGERISARHVTAFHFVSITVI